MSAPAAPRTAGALPLPHLALALAVVAIWGTNFVVIRLGLAKLPPLMFGALRFGLAALPWAFFLKRPPVAWRNLAAYGLLSGVGQFGLLFIAMKRDISPGLASLVLQSQVFFTVALAALLLRETIRGYQIAGMALAAAGLVVIALAAKGVAVTPLGLALTLVAALCWAGANLIAKRAVGVNMLAFMVWSSLFSAPPLLILSFLFEGGAASLKAVAHADAGAWAAVLWQSVGNTLFGFGAWNWLLARHPAAAVTPTALLIPVFGMVASFLVLGEPLEPWKLAAAGLVLAGLVVVVVWPLRARRAAAAAAAERTPSA